MQQHNWYKVERAIVGSYAQTMLRLSIQRRETPPAGPKIVVANHPTTTDAVLIMLADEEPMHILITSMCFEMPGLGPALRKAGHIPVVAEQGRQAFDQALDLLRSGTSVCVFPEGALSPLQGGMHRLHNGAARLAMLTGAPVVPVGIALQRERIVHIDIARFYLSGAYAMTVGAPLHLDGDIADRSHVLAATDRISSRIAALSAQGVARIRPTLAGAAAWLPAPWATAL